MLTFDFSSKFSISFLANVQIIGKDVVVISRCFVYIYDPLNNPIETFFNSHLLLDLRNSLFEFLFQNLQNIHFAFRFGNFN